MGAVFQKPCFIGSPELRAASRTITKHWKSEDESPGLSAAGVPEAGEGGREKTGGPVHGASTGDMGQLRACGELKGRL